MVRTRNQNRHVIHEQNGQNSVWDFMIYGLRQTSSALNNLIMELKEYLSYTRNVPTLANNQIRNFVLEVLNLSNRIHKLKDRFVGIGDIGEVYLLRIREINQLETRVQILMRKVNDELTKRNALNYVSDIGVDNATDYYVYTTNGRKI
jgi:hypothetical protein